MLFTYYARGAVFLVYLWCTYCLISYLQNVLDRQEKKIKSNVSTTIRDVFINF